MSEPVQAPVLPALFADVSQWETASLPQLREVLRRLTGGPLSMSKNRDWLVSKVRTLALQAGYDLPVSAQLAARARAKSSGPNRGAGLAVLSPGALPSSGARTRGLPNATATAHGHAQLSGAAAAETQAEELFRGARARIAPKRFLQEGGPGRLLSVERDEMTAAAGGTAPSSGPQTGHTQGVRSPDAPPLKRKRTSRGHARPCDHFPGHGGSAPSHHGGSGQPMSMVTSPPRLKSTSMGRLTRMHPVRRKPSSGGANVNTCGASNAGGECAPAYGTSLAGNMACAGGPVAPLASMRLACGTVLCPGDDVFVLSPKGLRELHTCAVCRNATNGAPDGGPAPPATAASAPPPPGTALLECDRCLRGFHLPCVQLSAVPEGDWTCDDCRAAGVALAATAADGALAGEEDAECEEMDCLPSNPVAEPYPVGVTPAGVMQPSARPMIDDLDRVDAGWLHLARVEALWWDPIKRAVLFRARWYHCAGGPGGDATVTAAAAVQKAGGSRGPVRWWVPGVRTPLREVALCPPATSDIAAIGSVLRRAHVVQPAQAARAARQAAAEGRPLPAVCHRGYDPRLKRFTPLPTVTGRA